MRTLGLPLPYFEVQYPKIKSSEIQEILGAIIFFHTKNFCGKVKGGIKRGAEDELEGESTCAILENEG